MKKIFCAVIVFCSFLQFSFAQNENVSLLLQSAHGHSVKMIWFIKSWNNEIRGFDIKRREGLQKEWIQINKAPIQLSISLKKDLSIIESDKGESERLKSVLIGYISEHKIREIDSTNFMKKLNSGDQFLRDFSKIISEDYDMALISGFAFIDRTTTKKIDYEYGLFIHGTDKLLAKANWNYGETPDLNIISDITTKSILNKRGIKIMWDVDLKKLKAGYVHGFNIYRDGIRLNQDPVMIAYNNDLSKFEWFDSTANSSIPNQYSIGSESFLDIEGIIKPYTYNPTDHPESYKKASINRVASLGYYFKEGIELNWDFPKEYERFIKGFYIEKDNIPDGYKPVSQFLEPNTRGFVDKTASPVSTYLRFKVLAVYKDMTMVQSNDKVYSYFPIREPPLPENIRVNAEIVEKKCIIKINWDPPMDGDTLTDYYKIYTFDAISNKMVSNPKIPNVKTNIFAYEISDNSNESYKFCISSYSKNKTESQLSDTIMVIPPTLVLPKPIISTVKQYNNDIVLNWQYPNIRDLSGYRIYQNGKLIANEAIVNKSMKEFIVKEVKMDNNLNFSMRAITDHNIVSEESEKVFFEMPLPAKKKGK